MKYKILQLKNRNDYRFMDYEYACKHGLSLDDYDVVYEGNVDEILGYRALEKLFFKFNVNRPDDFKGHSLSVSDIVVLEDNFYWYCDSIGWKAYHSYDVIKDN